MYPLHKNDTGSFQELAHSSDVKFGQLSMLKVNIGGIRGGHYHKRKEEWFCCIRGRCQMDIVKDGTTRSIILDGDKSEFVLISPYEKHTVVNAGCLQVCELLIIASEDYKPEDSDTFKEQ